VPWRDRRSWRTGWNLQVQGSSLAERISTGFQAGGRPPHAEIPVVLDLLFGRRRMPAERSAATDQELFLARHPPRSDWSLRSLKGRQLQAKTQAPSQAEAKPWSLGQSAMTTAACY